MIAQYLFTEIIIIYEKAVRLAMHCLGAPVHRSSFFFFFIVEGAVTLHFT